MKLLGRDTTVDPPIFLENFSAAFGDSELVEKLYILSAELKLSRDGLLGEIELRRRFAGDDDDDVDR